MNLLRRRTEKNDFAERAGTKTITAYRLGKSFTLRFTRYSKTKTYIRIYLISNQYYTEIVQKWGILTDHCHLRSEYFIVPNRKTFTVWIAECDTTKNVIAVSPNQQETPLKNSVKVLNYLANTKSPLRKIPTEKTMWFVYQLTMERKHYAKMQPITSDD